MKRKLRIGLIGDGHQVRGTHLPYLEKRSAEEQDVEISWVGGCLCAPREQQNCPMRGRYRIIPYNQNDYDWSGHFRDNPVDAVIVSNPNAFHAQVICAAFAKGVNVAVEKPTAIASIECVRLVALAKEKGLVFLTLSQRRYEDVYQKCKEIIENKKLGKILLINYLISHGFDKTSDGLGFDLQSWRFNKGISGGGVLIDSAYHGIDTLLWLMKHSPDAEQYVPASVSARCLRRGGDNTSVVETVAAVRILFRGGGIFNIVASYENPQKSLDENIKIFGEKGAIRLMRDRLEIKDQSAAKLTYQSADGAFTEFDTTQMAGKRWAPVKDFIDAIVDERKPDSVLSPAEGSIETIGVIEAAYESAARDGEEVSPDFHAKKSGVIGIHHVAVQTSSFEKSVTFYTDILGAQLLERRKFKKRDMAWLKAGNVRIELFSKRDGEQLTPWNDFYSGPVHIAILVENLDVFLEAARQKGAQFHPSHPAPFVPPVPGASKIAYLLGPDGEEIEIRAAGS